MISRLVPIQMVQGSLALPSRTPSGAIVIKYEKAGVVPRFSRSETLALLPNGLGLILSPGAFRCKDVNEVRTNVH